MITAEYKDEITEFHKQSDRWGSRGYTWSYMVTGMALVEGCRSVLDFGCGKGSLAQSVFKAGIKVREYDPGIPAKSAFPSPADLVVCTDVMEHVEPEHLQETIDALWQLTNRILFVAIATRPAGKTLPSGRNAHLIVQRAEWWRAKFESIGFKTKRTWSSSEDEWVAMLRKG